MAGSATNPDQPSSSSEHVAEPPSSDRPASREQINLDVSDFESTYEPVTRPANPRSAPPPRRERIGGCKLGRMLGKGGMGTVFLGEQEKLKRQVAVKIIKAGRSDDPEDLERFRREAKLAGSLQHPNIVQVYDVGEEDNLAYLVMEYIEGGTLHGHLGGKPMEVLQAALMLEQIARGIHYAHQKGIVHRDLKPGNILLVHAGNGLPSVKPTPEHHDTLPTKVVLVTDEPERPAALPHLKMIPKITDFGLAKDIARNSLSGPLTATGIALGTPSYMAPEQARGDAKTIGVGSDIYALGAILYEMLTGKPPFTGENAQQIMERLCLRPPQPPSKVRPSIPPELEKICLKCLAKDPRRRYPTGESLADALRKFVDRAAATEKVELSLSQWVKRSPWPLRLLLFGMFAGSGVALYLIWASWAGVTGSRDKAVAAYLQSTDVVRRQQIDAARGVFEDGYRLAERGEILRGLQRMRESATVLHRIAAGLDDPPSGEAESLRSRIDAYLLAVNLNMREWDRQRLRFRFDVMPEPAVGFSFSPRGTWLATLDRDGTLGVFMFDFDPTDTNYLCRTVLLKEFLPVAAGDEPRFAWSGDENRLAVSCGSRFREYDLKETKPLGEARATPSQSILDLIYDPTSSLFSIGNDGSLRRYAAGSESVKEYGPFPTPNRSGALALSADGRTLALATETDGLLLLDSIDPKPRGEVVRFPSPLRAFARTPGLDELLLGTRDGTSYRFSLAARRLTPLPDQGITVESLSSSSSGFVGLLGGDAQNQSLRVLDTDSLTDLATPLRTERRIRTVSAHATQPMLAVGFEDGSIGIYAVPRCSSTLMLSLTDKPSPLIRVQYSKEGRTLMLLGGEGARLFHGEGWRNRSDLVKPPFEVLSGALHPTQPGVAFGGPKGQLVYSMPLKRDSFRSMENGGESRFTQVEFVPNEEAIFGYATPRPGRADRPGSRLDEGSFYWPIQAVRGNLKLENFPPVRQLRFGGTVHDLATASSDGRARLIDLDRVNDSNRPEFSLGSSATAVALHDKQFRLAAGGEDGQLAVWESQARRELWDRPAHRAGVTSLAFSPEGKLLVSVAADGTIRIWDAETGLPVGPMRHHGAAVRSMAFDPKGTEFVTAGVDGQAKFWPFK